MARKPLVTDNWITNDLKAERVRRGISLVEMGRQLGVGKDTVGHWERGAVAPAIDRVILWAVALGYHLDLERR